MLIVCKLAEAKVLFCTFLAHINLIKVFPLSVKLSFFSLYKVESFWIGWRGWSEKWENWQKKQRGVAKCCKKWENGFFLGYKGGKNGNFKGENFENLLYGSNYLKMVQILYSKKK